MKDTRITRERLDVIDSEVAACVDRVPGLNGSEPHEEQLELLRSYRATHYPEKLDSTCPEPPDPHGHNWGGPMDCCVNCGTMRGQGAALRLCEYRKPPWNPEPPRGARSVRLLEVRYAPSPDGPWGEPSYVTPAKDLPLSDWSPVTRRACGEHEYGQERVVEYVPREPAQVADAATASDVELGCVASALYRAQGYGEWPPISFAMLEKHIDLARAAVAALRSRPAVVDAEAELARWVDRSVEAERLLDEALELVAQYRAQWGSENLAHKWGLPEDEKALVEKREALRSLVGRKA